MTTQWLLASLHLLALGIGLGAVWFRGQALRSRLDAAGLRMVFQADNFWGLAALLWISTGVWRVLAGVEKNTEYYFQNHFFLTKMALLVVILVLEVQPMRTLIGWRRRLAAGEQPATTLAPALARTSTIQAALIALMVFLAAARARGYGVSS